MFGSEKCKNRLLGLGVLGKVLIHRIFHHLSEKLGQRLTIHFLVVQILKMSGNLRGILPYIKSGVSYLESELLIILKEEITEHRALHIGLIQNTHILALHKGLHLVKIQQLSGGEEIENGFLRRFARIEQEITTYAQRGNEQNEDDRDDEFPAFSFIRKLRQSIHVGIAA